MNKFKPILPIMIFATLLLAGCSGAASLASWPVNVLQPRALQVASTTAPSENASPAPLNAASSETMAAFEGTLVNIYEQVNPSVVNVEVLSTGSSTNGLQNSPFGSDNSTPTEQGLGSGFVWDQEGHIVTNNHVVAGADQIRVTFADETTVDAELVGTDPNSDLAVIKVDMPADQLHPVTLLDSSEVKVGQLAIAIGNPYGLSGTMTSGIISGLSRSLPVGLDNAISASGPRYSIPDIIQTDASINPGNSGGVLVDDQGQLIGVTAAIQSTTGSNSGIGFVIPANIVRKVVPALIENGRVEHAWLGISGTTLTTDLAQAANLPEDQQGVLVVEVTQGGPAERAGLQAGDQQVTVGGEQLPVGGDVITAVDGQTVNNFEDLVSYLYNQTEVGQKVTLMVLRDGQQQSLDVTLGTLPSQP